MAEKWKDRLVEFPKRYTLTLVTGSTYDIEAAPGTVTEAGTYVTAERMNKIQERTTFQIAMSGWRF
jgi:hypothetical protein